MEDKAIFTKAKTFCDVSIIKLMNGLSISSPVELHRLHIIRICCLLSADRNNHKISFLTAQWVQMIFRLKDCSLIVVYKYIRSSSQKSVVTCLY